MYESFFGLRKRPYAAAPDAETLVATPSVSDAIGRLDRCVRQGRGIAVLTAAAGMGKTHLCHRLAQQWTGDFRVVLLPNAGFSTRRGLLQSILAELEHPYQRLGETELRLELTAAARAARQERGGIVVLFDEAHRNSERVLEEIRLIANLVEASEPLVRVVLAGQLELEERLADPAMAALNERVGELVTLPRLTAEESRHYLSERAVAAGGTLETLFEPPAAEILVQACGGVPRCLNQLADHGLLLGYVAERRPVDEGLIREALDDLKRLPLHWHDPLPSVERSETTTVQASVETHEAISSEFADAIEVGGLDEDRAMEAYESPLTNQGPEPEEESTAFEMSGFERELETPSTRQAVEAFASLPQPMTESIEDRFARLDAADAQRRWVELLDRELGKSREQKAPTSFEQPVAEAKPTPNPLELLDRIEPLIAEALGERASETCPTPMASPSGRMEPSERREGSAAIKHSTLFSDLRRRRRNEPQRVEG